MPTYYEKRTGEAIEAIQVDEMQNRKWLKKHVQPANWRVHRNYGLQVSSPDQSAWLSLSELDFIAIIDGTPQRILREAFRARYSCGKPSVIDTIDAVKHDLKVEFGDTTSYDIVVSGINDIIDALTDTPDISPAPSHQSLHELAEMVEKAYRQPGISNEKVIKLAKIAQQLRYL